MKRVIFLTQLWLWVVCSCYSQELISTSGGNVSNSFGTVSYSIGQLFYQTNVHAQGHELQGIQQPFEDLEITTVFGSLEKIHLNVSYYPNPVKESLFLTIQEKDFNGITCELIDAHGLSIRKFDITDQNTAISMYQLEPSIYYLNIQKKSILVSTFKIIKK